MKRDWYRDTIDSDDEAIEAQRQRVVHALGAGPATAPELARELDLTSYEVRRALQGLRRRGIVVPPMGEARRGAPPFDDGPPRYNLAHGPFTA